MALDPNNRDTQNLLEAASTGAAMSVRVVANITANLIAFLAVLAFINAALSWLGDLVDIQGLSFQVQFWVACWACGGGQPVEGAARALGVGAWLAQVPAAPLASCLSSSAPTSCCLWLS